MMEDSWIVELLTRCEAVMGELGQIRGNLSKDEWLSAIWELILLDAAMPLGSVKYEPAVDNNVHPDLQFDSYSGVRLYIEAAFLEKEKANQVKKIDDHPIFRVLKKKGRKAKDAGAVEPYVVFLGTDRVFDISSSRHTGGVGFEEAITKAFQSHRSLSAVVLASIFARPEVFKPLQKRPRAWLYENPAARIPLTSKSIDVINRFDFERWPFDRFMRLNKKRPELRKALSLNKYSRENYSLSERRLQAYPQDDRKLPYPCWTYIWRFNRLRIAKMGSEYWLYRGREFFNVSAQTPEQVAECASELFQICPTHILGPNGPERHPDPGVPSDLNQWILELPDQSSEHGGE